MALGYESNRTADEFGIWLIQLLTQHGINKEDITDAIIATVVPDNLIHLKNLCRQYFKTDATVVGDPEVTLGLNIKVDNPERLGLIDFVTRSRPTSLMLDHF